MGHTTFSIPVCYQVSILKVECKCKWRIRSPCEDTTDVILGREEAEKMNKLQVSRVPTNAKNLRDDIVMSLSPLKDTTLISNHSILVYYFRSTLVLLSHVTSYIT